MFKCGEVDKMVFACSFRRVFSLLLIQFMRFYWQNSCNSIKFDSIRTWIGKCENSTKRSLQRDEKEYFDEEHTHARTSIFL